MLCWSFPLVLSAHHKVHKVTSTSYLALNVHMSTSILSHRVLHVKYCERIANSLDVSSRLFISRGSVLSAVYCRLICTPTNDGWTHRDGSWNCERKIAFFKQRFTFLMRQRWLTLGVFWCTKGQIINKSQKWNEMEKFDVNMIAMQIMSMLPMLQNSFTLNDVVSLSMKIMHLFIWYWLSFNRISLIIRRN